MKRQQRKKIEWEFFHYEESRNRAGSFVAERALDGGSTDFSEPRVNSSPQGNPAERRIISLVSEAERVSRWCTVFEKTLDRFRWTQKGELMRRRYIQKETDVATCVGISIDRSTYYHWLNEILSIALMWARECRIL